MAKRESWNRRSARWNPFFVSLVCAALIVLNYRRERWLYIFPLVVLGSHATSAFVFWMIRLSKTRSEAWRKAVISFGVVSQVFGFAGLASLVVMLIDLIIMPGRLSERFGEPDGKFWVLWAWTAIEIIHAHVYKITFGKRDTLEYVLRERCWADAAWPLGGAIGRQISKVRQQHASGSCDTHRPGGE